MTADKPDDRAEVVHPIPPVYDVHSCVLILGSFPSVKSREQGFFYGHPQNRFWRVLAGVIGEKVPLSVEEKRVFLLRNRIALWDVIGSCRIRGSADSSIREAVPNDLSVLLRTADIRQIYANGHTAANLYERYLKPQTGRAAMCLPSTSPANASWSPERLLEAWSVIRGTLAERKNP